jgi:hypothetical protein
MYEQFGMLRQMMDMQKASVDGFMTGLIMMWDQTAVLFDSAVWLPEDGKKAFRQWVDLNKKACEDLKSAVGGSYFRMEKVSETAAKKTEKAVSRPVAGKPRSEDPGKAGDVEVGKAANN